MQTWSTPAMGHSSMVLADAASFDFNHFTDQNLESQYSHPAAGSIPVAFHEPVQQNEAETFGLALTATGSPSTDAWRPGSRIMNGFDTRSGGLGSVLFPSTGLDLHTVAPHAPSYEDLGPSFSQLSRKYNDPQITNISNYNCEHVYQQSPSVVVPSQLSPMEDYTLSSMAVEHTHSPVHPDMLASSFGSVTSSDMLDYEMVEPESPVDAYFAHSDNEDYAIVKHDAAAIPTKDPLAHWYSESKSLPRRTKRRPSKRLRNGLKGATWYSHMSSDYNCIVDCDFNGWGMARDGTIQFAAPQRNNAHPCNYTNADGTLCGKRFARSEHLKRHEGTHSNDRPYPCPLAGCGKRIQRPDNAGDHFKTHLRPPKTGKRNAHVEWSILESAIERAYEDKRKSKKLLDGLRRWVENGMPEATSSRKCTRV